jgi:hypothetical protein
MIAKDQDQINKATENEVNKTAKKVARMYYFSQITPKGVLKKLKQEE